MYKQTGFLFADNEILKGLVEADACLVLLHVCFPVQPRDLI